ncbi:hypothetical protein Vadar_018724 [Vaccinium darrowii]|uniref:Uncharacterized protein n=1 Tax=Vaccinium darrowii TaxID=229202 RepID=A0ACB7YN16_9ERIC|nr:hypothetical protein Vadar_018724 [Vaccinium darrowii]
MIDGEDSVEAADVAELVVGLTMEDFATVAVEELDIFGVVGEFEDVQRLAAELCGRLHPQFRLVTGIQIRGTDSIVLPAMLEIRNTVENILLWPSLDGDEGTPSIPLIVSPLSKDRV